MTTYTNTLREIYDLQIFAMKLGLENIRALAGALDSPQLSYPVIHVAGTNGKGSTCFFVARILESAGLRVGLYTSPHLVDFRERIQVNGEKISQAFVCSFWEKMRALVYERKATFFDVTTALAFDYFRSCSVDVAVIETGLGGRLDSTNIVQPEMIVITPIDFDHEKQLGNNLTAIAFEKAGIFKESVPVYSARQADEAEACLRKHLRPGSAFYKLEDHISVDVHRTSLEGSIFSLTDRYHQERLVNLTCLQPGDFQLNNIALAYFVSRAFLVKHHIPFSGAAFAAVIAKHVWAGRLHMVSRHPDILFDVSHNYHGIVHTVTFLEKHCNRDHMVLLIGLVKDKDYHAIARFISGRFREIILTEPDTPRKLDGEELRKAFKSAGQNTILIKDLRKAYESANKKLRPEDTLLVLGSHYLIGAYLSDSN